LLRSSHVGSFPLDYSLENTERIIVDLSSIGLDAPPYPQLRGFIDIYVEPLVQAGSVKREKGFLYALSPNNLLSWKRGVNAPEAEYTVETIKRLKLGFKHLRAPVTGPFTLASRIYLSMDSRDLSSTALTYKDLVKAFFTRYSSAWVEYMSMLGYNLIFLDEPILGVIIGARRNLYGYSDEDIVEVLDTVAKSAHSAEVGVHVCGRVHRRILEVLSSTSRVKYFSLEFHDSQQNIEILDKHLLEERDKLISPGIVSSRVPRLESLEEAFSLLNKVYRVTGGRIDLVSGDCGFAGLKGALGNPEAEYELALSKLKIVVNACKRLSSG
jgi:5-methyltetrahydropteroyltriglutamate--homocysteine methyltransferase